MNSFWTDKKVLVTGHTGFKGSWLTLWLLKLGADVWGFSLRPETKPSLFIELDLEKSIPDQCDGDFHQEIGDIRNHQLLD